jgi:hypothetical protein
MLLWASAKIPDLLTGVEQKAIVDEAFTKQQSDGGFSLAAFVNGWKRHDGTPLDHRSDGYATGVITYALLESGLAPQDPRLQKALAWLQHNQSKADGRWCAYSLNKERDLNSDVGRFMSDAATAYAVLALDRAK